MKTVRLVLIGFGNVGQALARLLLSKEAELREAHGLALKVVGIGTGSHGVASNPDGLDLALAVRLAEAAGDLNQLTRPPALPATCLPRPQARVAQTQVSEAEGPARLDGSTELAEVRARRGLTKVEGPAPADNLQLLLQVEAEALLESIPVDYQTGQPAIRYLTTALERGMHAITANKGPVVHAYDSIRALARRHGRSFRFESAVMDGAPLFSLWRECLPGARLQSFRGVLNSTTNLILSLMEGGASFEAAVAEAQRRGIAETDPSGDVEGWDAAIKVAALATVLMEVPIRIQDVQRKGIEDLTAGDVRQAAGAGRRWKLVCSAVREGSRVQARVRPELVTPSDPLYHIMGTSSGVTFESDVLGDLTITETDPGPHTTAYGMLADLLTVIRAADPDGHSSRETAVSP